MEKSHPSSGGDLSHPFLMLNQQILVIKSLFLQHSFLCDPQAPLLSVWLSCPQSVISPELLSQLHFQICPVEYRISAQD